MAQVVQDCRRGAYDRGVRVVQRQQRHHRVDQRALGQQRRS